MFEMTSESSSILKTNNINILLSQICTSKSIEQYINLKKSLVDLHKIKTECHQKKENHLLIPLF